MKTTKIILLAMLMSFGLNTIAQVAVNNDGSEPDSSAMVDIKSSNKGFLLPRLTTREQIDINDPAMGLLIFNTDSLNFWYYDGTYWLSFDINPNDTIYNWDCGDGLDYGGQTYSTVQIGTQCWFAENLNYATTNSWWYNDIEANGDVYGRLYTWDAALTACPSGWSLPSDDQWKTLEMALGMSQSEADDTFLRGTDEGGKMKETGTIHWNSPNTGATNTSGFTALPGGYRHSSGSFNILGNNGYWWSSSENSGTSAWRRYLYYDFGQVGRYDGYKTYGFSVRCLKD